MGGQVCKLPEYEPSSRRCRFSGPVPDGEEMGAPKARYATVAGQIRDRSRLTATHTWQMRDRVGDPPRYVL